MGWLPPWMRKPTACRETVARPKVVISRMRDGVNAKLAVERWQRRGMHPNAGGGLGHLAHGSYLRRLMPWFGSRAPQKEWKTRADSVTLKSMKLMARRRG